MKSILLIGLGRFGRHIAMKLDELHHHVMAVDKEDTRVDAVLPFVTNAQIGDATNEDFLSSKDHHIIIRMQERCLSECQWIRPVKI